MPYYSVANSNTEDTHQNKKTLPQPSEDGVKKLLAEFQKNIEKKNPEIAKKINKISLLAKAIESGTIKEHMANSNYTANDKDYFLLANQTSEAIVYHVKRYNNKKRVVPVVEYISSLNDYGSRPITRVFKEVHVRYHKKSKRLILEGVSQGAVHLRQYIPNLDIIDYIYDQEMLILLDKNKGLLLVDMFFAKTFLGNAPIPISKIPTAILHTLNKADPTLLNTNTEKLSLEFINRGVTPPDVIPTSIKSISKNFEHQHVFKAGDFMLSYIDHNNKKNLVQFIKRSELKTWLKLHYNILDIMTKVIAPQLIQPDDFKKFTKNINQEKNQNPEIVLDNVLSALFTKPALSKLVQTAQGMQLRLDQLDESVPRDTMLFREWQQSFDKISSRLQKKHLPNNITGTLPNTEELIELQKKSKKETKKQKNIRATALRIMATTIEAINQNKIFTTAMSISVGGGVYLITQDYIQLSNIYISMTEKIFSVGGVDNKLFFLDSTAANLVSIAIVIPAIVFTLSFLSVPFMQFLNKTLPNNVSIGKKVFHPKGYTEDFLNKWSDTNAIQRTIGAGMQMVAYAMYPMWNYIGSIVGQPHFLSAIQKGLNPFRKIDPKSDIGQVAKLTKPTRLGSQGFFPKWKQNKAFNRHRILQNITATKEQKMHSISWLMASLAVAEKHKVTPEEILIYGASVNVNKLGAIYNEDALRVEMLWVMEHLLKEIRQLDELDIRENINELKPQLIEKYYKKATQLAKEVKKHSAFRKNVRLIFNSKTIYALKQKLSLQSISNFNKKQHETLKQVPAKFVENRILKNFSVDHIFMTIIPLILTDRSNMLSHHIDTLAVGSNNTSWSGSPHMIEIWQNVITHLFVAGAALTLTFQNIANSLGILNSNQAKKYDPAELYTHKTKKRIQKDGSFYRNLFKSAFKLGSKDWSLGAVFLKSNRARLRVIQMGFLLIVPMRYFLTDQNLEHAILGYMFFWFLGDWFFNWPWYILGGGDKMNDIMLTKNIKIIETLKTKFSKIARGIHSNTQSMRKEYQEGLLSLKQLYTTIPLNNDMIYADKNISIENIQKISKHVVQILSITPPLANTKNHTADFVSTFLLAGILTNLLFVTLSIASFDTDYLRWDLVALIGVSHFTLLELVNYFYSKTLTDHMKSIKNWNQYFYSRFLKLNRSVANRCMGTFKAKL